MISGAPCRGFKVKISSVISISSLASESSRTRKSARLRSSRSPGCWHKAKTLCQSPGSKRCKYLQENVGALDVDLTAADLARIDEVAPADAFAGSRYPKTMMDLLNP
jgi:diketogulonate reductase-like aldo/keto reductase